MHCLVWKDLEYCVEKNNEVKDFNLVFNLNHPPYCFEVSCDPPYCFEVSCPSRLKYHVCLLIVMKCHVTAQCLLHPPHYILKNIIGCRTARKE